MVLDTQDKRGAFPHPSTKATGPHPPAPAFESARAAADERIERLANDARILRTRIAEGTETLSQQARDRVLKAREAAADAAEQAVEAMRSGAQKTKDVVQENPPLAVGGGIALAVGAGGLAGVMLLRKQDEASRAARNEVFREADRIMKEELGGRSGSSSTLRSRP